MTLSTCCSCGFSMQPILSSMRHIVCTNQFWFSQNLGKIWLFMSTCWGLSSCALVSPDLKPLPVVGGKYVLVGGFLWKVERFQWLNLKLLRHGGERTKNPGDLTPLTKVWICEHIWLLVQWLSGWLKASVFMHTVAAQQYSRNNHSLWKCWQLTDSWQMCSGKLLSY